MCLSCFPFAGAYFHPDKSSNKDIVRRVMSLTNASLVPSEGASIAAVSISAVIHPTLSYIGAQFHGDNEPPNKASVTKASDSIANAQKPIDTSFCHKMLEKYLKTVDRSEILRIGKQTSHSSRAFHHHLICTIDRTLLQLETSTIEEIVTIPPHG